MRLRQFAFPCLEVRCGPVRGLACLRQIGLRRFEARGRGAGRVACLGEVVVQGGELRGRRAGRSRAWARSLVRASSLAAGVLARFRQLGLERVFFGRPLDCRLRVPLLGVRKRGLHPLPGLQQGIAHGQALGLPRPRHRRERGFRLIERLFERRRRRRLCRLLGSGRIGDLPGGPQTHRGRRPVAAQRHRAHLDGPSRGRAGGDVVVQVGVCALADALHDLHHASAVVSRDEAVELGAHQVLEALDLEQAKGAGVGREDCPVWRGDREADRRRFDDQPQAGFRCTLRRCRRRCLWSRRLGTSPGFK